MIRQHDIFICNFCSIARKFAFVPFLHLDPFVLPQRAGLYVGTGFSVKVIKL